MGPFEVRGELGSVGRVSEAALLAWALVSAAALLAIYHLTGSEALQVLALFALVSPWRWMQRWAAATRPLPAYPDPPPKQRPAWQRWAITILGAVMLGLALGEATLRFGGGVAFWAFIGFLVPMIFFLNRYGVAQRSKPSHRNRLSHRFGGRRLKDR